MLAGPATSSAEIPDAGVKGVSLILTTLRPVVILPVVILKEIELTMEKFAKKDCL